MNRGAVQRLFDTDARLSDDPAPALLVACDQGGDMRRVLAARFEGLTGEPLSEIRQLRR